MKNLVKLISVVVFLTVNFMNSQTISHNRSNRSSSVSVKGTNSSYKFRAFFDEDLTKSVQKLLQKELKGKRFTDTNNSTFWSITKNNEKAFKCKVGKGYVRIFVDKEVMPKQFQNEVEKIGEDLRYIISGS